MQCTLSFHHKDSLNHIEEIKSCIKKSQGTLIAYDTDFALNFDIKTEDPKIFYSKFKAFDLDIPGQITFGNPIEVNNSLDSDPTKAWSRTT